MQHPVQIIPIPAFKDNYIWLLHDHKYATVVDPGDAAAVLSTLQAMQLTLDTILITHYHHDHIGGVAALQQAYSHVRTYAPAAEQYDFPHHPVIEPDQISLPTLGLQLQVIDLPGHTLGHIAYYIAGNIPRLFCGDTLFGAGCGRLFEGTPAQMYSSLQKLVALPAETQVYCTHEYTLHNIGFARMIDPSNLALSQRQQDTQALRDRQLPSLPTTIAQELATNPFLRCNDVAIKNTLKMPDANDLQIFTAIREMRNHY